jgi:hypothetical protein
MKRNVLEDPAVRVVRIDMVEAWARHVYGLQTLPGYTTSVRRAVLCQCDDGRAAYVEYTGVGWRLWRRTQWIGPMAELGPPRPVPRGFEVARGLRLYRVRERSMVLRIGGVDRIVSFTGEELPEGGHVLRQLALQAVLLVPNVGTVVDWSMTAAHRLKPGSTGPQAIAAATYWRAEINAALGAPALAVAA